MFVTPTIPNRWRQARTTGFTLVELITAIVIIGLLSAAAIPRLFNNNTFTERGYVDELASSLRYSRRIAIASRCEVAVTINAAGHSAAQRSSLLACDSRSGVWGTPVRRPDGSLLQSTTPTEVMVAPTGTVVFDVDGSIQGGNPTAYTVGPFTLTIDGTSGTVTVQP